MTVPRVDDPNDQFPIGMRVLAVDDDPTCLLLLETLLRRCQYHVTTTKQAIVALNMLRENKNKFDLVISDVHMPDMDGFKLLELVGLEMDLPVIMLSANGDPKLVMKGITHGACDYLLKPVRIEELKNIWQHVIRRKKFDRKEQNNSENCDKSYNSSGESLGKGNQDQSRKRKDQDEDEDEEHDDSGHDNEDPSAQKKPRVVWSVDLHRKFVAAVHQLGIDKAVPKKILELMNVERLTRENVASHLQKYRLYLKRISSVANQQANMMAALGNANAPYLRINSMSGPGILLSSSVSGQFQNAPFNSFQHNSMLGRLNSPSLGLRGLPYSGSMQLGHSQNYSNCTRDQGKLQQMLPEDNNGTILQGLPTSLEVDQLQSHSGGKGIAQVGQSSKIFNNTVGFPVTRGFPDVKSSFGSLSSLQTGAMNNLLMPECPIQAGNKFGIQSTFLAGSNPSFSTDITGLGCSNNSWLDASHLSRVRFDKCNGNWSMASQPVVQSSSLPSTDCVRQSTSHPGSSGGNISTVALGIGSNLCNASSIISSYQQQNSTVDMQYQRTSLCGNPMSTDPVPSQGWGEHNHGSLYKTNVLSVNSSVSHNDALGSLGHTLDSRNISYNTDFDLTGGQDNSQGRHVGNNIGSLEDIVNVLMKEE